MEKKMSKKEEYDQKALEYVEKYGIIEYTVKGSKMTYYVTYPTEGTYKHVINLKDMSENITSLKRRKKIGNYNRG